MKIYELRAVYQEQFGDDCNQLVIVKAKSKDHARELASQQAALEGPGVWLDPEKTICKRLNLKEQGSRVITLFHQL